MNTASDKSPCELVTVGADLTCASPTLQPAALQDIRTALRSVPWYRDRWSAKSFRTSLIRIFQRYSPGGLILIGPRTKFEVPPPFEHLFEPIALGSDDERLKTLSGEKPTRQECLNRFALWALATLGFLLFVTITAGLWFGFSRFIATILLAMFTFFAVLGTMVKYAAEFVRTWYLLPGSVAILRRLRRGRN